MDYALEQVVRSQLAANEKLLWTGQPRGGIRFRATDAFLIPFSLLWCGFAIFWELSVLEQGAPGFFALWGIPFVAFGLYFVIGRFFVDALARGRTYYALTDQRAIIVSGLVNQQVKSLPLRTMSDVTVTERADGSGTITLGPSIGMYGWFAGSGWPGRGRYQPPAFEMIEDVGRVNNLLRDAQSRAT
jgi:Bacterial PH domain